jgi:hypothetical protein
MKHRITKSALAGAALAALLAGCATTVDMGGPLGHYRYHADTLPTSDDTTATYHEQTVTTYGPSAVVERPAPAVTYREHSVTRYDEPVAVRPSEPAAVYREHSVTKYDQPAVVVRPVEPALTYREHTVTRSDEPAVVERSAPAVTIHRDDDDD